MLGFTNTKSQLALSSSLVQSSGSRCYRAPIVQEVGNLPSVARLRASNEVRYVVAVAPRTIASKVINVGSDTYGNPIFHEGLQNQPFSWIISVLGCFA